MLCELPEFEYHEPKSVEEAVQILRSYGGRAKILAGGTDLLGLMKDRISGKSMPVPQALLSIKGIAELRSIRHEAHASTVGAGVTLTEIGRDVVLSARFPAFSQAAESVGTNQIRNVGTLGGNLCQRPWCWYFRHPAFDCFKKGGEKCFAITGKNSTYFSLYDLGVCVAAQPSDTAVALVALDATANLVGPSGSRAVSMHDFFASPRQREDHVMRDDEMMVSVTLPQTWTHSVFLKQRVRENWDFSLASVAAVARRSGGALESVKVVLGGVAPRPFVLSGLDGLLARGLTRDVESRVSDLVASESHPLRFNKYKKRIVRALVMRSLRSVLD